MVYIAHSASKLAALATTFDHCLTSILREGSKKSVNFRSDPFFKLDRLDTTCDGNRAGDIFHLEVGEDDCRIEAFFEDGGFDVRVQNHFNSLLNSVQDTLSGRNPSGEAACDGACD